MDIVVRTIALHMAGEPFSKQLKAFLAELDRQGIDFEQIKEKERLPKRIAHRPPPSPDHRRVGSTGIAYHVLWSDQRLASLETMLQQGKTKAEIAEALSLQEKQISWGVRMLRERGR
jgi:hypothetical protein